MKADIARHVLCEGPSYEEEEGGGEENAVMPLCEGWKTLGESYCRDQVKGFHLRMQKRRQEKVS